VNEHLVSIGSASSSKRSEDVDVLDAEASIDIRRVDVAVHENILRVEDFHKELPVDDVELEEAATVEKHLLLIHHVQEFELKSLRHPLPILVHEQLALLVVIEVLEVDVRGIVNVR
jgi:hypothetical protein